MVSLTTSNRVRPEMMVAGPKTLAGTPPDGTVDYGPAASNMNQPFEVWNGRHGIDSNTIITDPFHARAGGQLVLGPGVHLKVDAAVWGDPYAQIFDTSAEGSKVTGSFGSCPITPAMWGAKPGALPDGTSADDPGAPAFNGLSAFQQCIAARRRSRAVAAKIYLPEGRWFIEGPPLPAIPNPDWYEGSLLPEFLCAEALLQILTGECFSGEKWDSCAIVVGNGSTGNSMAVGGWDTQGPPSDISNFMLVAQEGGAYGCYGFEFLANGIQASKLWANGFIRGFHFASTSQHGQNLMAEFCYEGYRFSRGTNSLITAEAHLCGVSYIVEHTDQQGVTILKDCAAINPNDSMPGLIGFAFTGLNTQVNVSGLNVEGNGFIQAYAVWFAKNATLTACSARLTGNASALSIGGATDVSVVDFNGEVLSGTPTSSIGLHIFDGASRIDITGGGFKGFFDNKVDTAGDTISIDNVRFTHSKGWNLDVVRATSLRMSGYVNYGVSGGIRAVMNHPDSWTFHAVQGLNGGVYTQDIGFKAEVNDADGRIRLTAGSMFRGNVTAQVQNITGMTGAPYFVMSSDCVS